MRQFATLDVSRLSEMVKELKTIGEKQKKVYDIYGNLIQTQCKGLEKIVCEYEMKDSYDFDDIAEDWQL